MAPKLTLILKSINFEFINFNLVIFNRQEQEKLKKAELQCLQGRRSISPRTEVYCTFRYEIETTPRLCNYFDTINVIIIYSADPVEEPGRNIGSSIRGRSHLVAKLYLKWDFCFKIVSRLFPFPTIL